MAGTLVLKFGGAAVAAPERFAVIAELIHSKLENCRSLAVVVSAMGDTTDELIALAKRVNPTPPRRELDMLVSTGERISIALLAMALAHRGIKAYSFTGSQSGIITSDEHNDAKIIEVRPHRLVARLAEQAVVIVAGFQGMSTKGEITTLGRGGSDTSAVALGVALEADAVEFYKDVEGIFDSDPRENPKARLLRQLSYNDALAIIAASKHQVLQARSVLLAQKNNLLLRVLPFANHADPQVGTWIGSPNRNKEVASLPEQSTPCYELTPR